MCVACLLPLLQLYQEASVPTSSFVGVPVFQAEGLTVTTQDMVRHPAATAPVSACACAHSTHTGGCCTLGCRLYAARTSANTSCLASDRVQLCDQSQAEAVYWLVLSCIEARGSDQQALEQESWCLQMACLLLGVGVCLPATCGFPQPADSACCLLLMMVRRLSTAGSTESACLMCNAV